MLSFQIPFRGEDEIHHVIGEIIVASQAFIAFETIRKQEVNIAIFRVAKNNRVGVAVRTKKFLQPSACRG